MIFEERLAKAWVLPVDYSSGRCMRCHLQWNVVEPHDTIFRTSEGAFSLCVDCWAELEPAARLPYYRALWLVWQEQERGSQSPEQREEVWTMLKRAVLEGK